MIVTPADFTPLIAPAEHPSPMTFLFRGDEFLARNGDLALPDAADCAALGLAPGDMHPIGMLGTTYCRAAWLATETAAPEGFAFTGLRALFGNVDDSIVAVAGRARQIVEWARTHRFCGACGSPAALVAGERAMKCTACGHSAYPRISPAMMVLVKRGPEILLARHRRGPGRYTALAGFLEPGESVEDAVHREVREEVGLEVKDLRYFASQSWPFPHSLMIAFTAEYAGGDVRTEVAEIAEARWFGPGDELPEISIRQSVARALIDANLPR
ncbi:MAG TPA: NAD(+) diphosphatase [Usitatibacteraceae bacterium]|nr:NAD(+) diphosphatase [Usitatibacteraceae bacterium]